ncbi:DUF2815 family protein [bacterium]|nr:DUF2815 family protein [bacterium]
MSNTQVKTGEVRFSYVHVFEPQEGQDGGRLKYSTAILIPKSDTKTIAALQAAQKAAIAEGKAKDSKFKPSRVPLRDGDTDPSKEGDALYAGHYFLNASANENRKPQVIDETRTKLLTSEDEFYSGCYGRAVLSFYAYDNVSKGVACGLEAIQKLRDGERLGGKRVDAFDAFADDEDSDDMLF